MGPFTTLRTTLRPVKLLHPDPLTPRVTTIPTSSPFLPHLSLSLSLLGPHGHITRVFDSTFFLNRSPSADPEVLVVLKQPRGRFLWGLRRSVRFS